MSIDDQEPDGTGVLPDPWDRLAETNETERAYAAFLAYRNLPPASRTAKRVVPLAYGAEYIEGHDRWKICLEQIQHWMALHQWRHRVALWDEDQANQRAAWDQQAILAMRERHAAISEELVDRARDAIIGYTGRWEPKDILRMLDLAFRTERLARGDSDKVTLTHLGPDGGPVQIDSGQSAEPDIENLTRIAAILEEAGVMPEGTANAVAVSLGTGTDTPPH